MLNFSVPFYLASKSPRRKELLSFLVSKFDIVHADINENVKPGEKPLEYSERISKDKLIEVRRKNDTGIILTADTIVTVDNKILGKPGSPSEAKEMLKLLSGKTHEVITSYCINYNRKTITKSEITSVKFAYLTDELIDSYVKTNSPMDKAGAYGIQDSHGAIIVEKINGCYYNVMGLPVSSLYFTLKEIKESLNL